jgi:hypothetical protein
MLGFTSYSHSDGQSCTNLNRLDASVDDLLASLIYRHGVVNTPAIVSAVSTSKQARFVVYKLMSVASRETLPLLLIHYYEVVEAVSLQSNYDLISELVSVFGAPMVANIIKVHGVDCTAMLRGVEGERMPCVVLVEGDVRAARLKEKREKESAAQKNGRVDAAGNVVKIANPVSKSEFDKVFQGGKTLIEEMNEDDDIGLDALDKHPF